MQRIALRKSPRRPAGFPVRNGGMRAFQAYSQATPPVAVVMIVASLAGAWAGCVLLGGSRTPAPHLFYVPIVLAAVRFAWPGAAATALAAGLLAGPLLPADVPTGIGQPPAAWLLRLVIFFGIGLFIALLVTGPEASVRSRLQNAVCAARLTRALKSGQIEVFYQPIYRLAGKGHTGEDVQDRLVGVEALARWRRPDGRLVGPGEFIPAAERTGVVADLDEYVLRQAVGTARSWSTDQQPISVSINLSAATLPMRHIVDVVETALRDNELPAHLLQLEITESALLGDLPAAIEQVQALRSLGVKVAIDDFGTGQASLNYLQSFCVDVVKLDRSLVTAASIDDRSHKLLQGVVDMCHLLGLHVVAEGVEFPDQLTVLRAVGVEMAQGFLLGRPARADQLEPLMRTVTP